MTSPVSPTSVEELRGKSNKETTDRVWYVQIYFNNLHKLSDDVTEFKKMVNWAGTEYIAIGLVFLLGWYIL